MYTIITNHWTGSLKEWGSLNDIRIMNEKEAVQKLAYFRFAYPESIFILLKDGWIVSTKELSELAYHILVD